MAIANYLLPPVARRRYARPAVYTPPQACGYGRSTATDLGSFDPPHVGCWGYLLGDVAVLPSTQFRGPAPVSPVEGHWRGVISLDRALESPTSSFR